MPGGSTPSEIELLCEWAEHYIASRPADFIIGSPDDPKLKRWYVVPRNKYMNIFLHEFHKSDPDVPHDHPWDNRSLILRGQYNEICLEGGNCQAQYARCAGDMVTRLAYEAHRILILPDQPPVLSLFTTGRVCREWGFHCPQGWVPATQFLRMYNGGNETGRGCGEL